MTLDSDIPETPKDGHEGESRIHQLLSPDYEQILNTIDKLREHGISRELGLPLPQIIVCGNQSSGKSSVIEAISGKQFPKSHECCTTFPTSLILRRGAPFFSASIKGKDIDTSNGTRNFEEIIEEAKQLLLGEGDKDKKEKSYFKDTLTIEIHQPGLLPLRIVDLPGLIQNTNKEQTPHDKKLVEEIVRTEMENKDSIILVIVSAKADSQANSVLEMIKTIDPNGKRTMGIITHPDELKSGSKTENLFVRMANNEEQYLGLGWHVVKNLDTEITQTEGGVYNSEERDKKEAEFFSKSVWRNAVGLDKRGIFALRTRLSLILEKRARKVLPIILDIVRTSLQTTTAELARIGEPRATPEEKRRYLTKISSSFKSLVEESLEAQYKDTTFFKPDSEFNEHDPRRLRTEVMNLSDQFSAIMHNRGHSSQFELFELGRIEAFEASMSWGQIIPPKMITRVDFIQRIRNLERMNRTLGPPGLPNHNIIPVLFHEQSQKWDTIAKLYVEKLTQVTQKCLDQIALHVAPDITSTAIRGKVISVAIEKKQELALQKIQELIRPFRRNFIVTLNNDFLQKVRHGKLRTKEADQEKSTDETSALTLDYTMLYYKIALDNFVDNIRNLCIEQCILDGLTDIFSPDTVSEMTVETLDQLGIESEFVEGQRFQLRTREEDLKKLLAICKQTTLYSSPSFLEAEMDDTIKSSEPKISAAKSNMFTSSQPMDGNGSGHSSILLSAGHSPASTLVGSTSGDISTSSSTTPIKNSSGGGVFESKPLFSTSSNRTPRFTFPATSNVAINPTSENKSVFG